MLNPQLEGQLQQLGLNPDTPPDPQMWARLLGEISQNYEARETTEAALEDSKRFFESMYEAARRPALELSLMFQVRSALANKLELADVIRTIVEVTAQTFGYKLVSVYLLEGDELVLQHQVGYDQVVARVPINNGVAGRVARTGRAVFLEDVSTNPDFIGAVAGLTAEICVPLKHDDKVVGILNVEVTHGQQLTHDDFDLLTALALDVEIAIKQASLYTALRDSNEKYQLVVDNVQEVIFRADLDGHWTFLNNAWEKMSGYSIQESLGQHVSGYLSPEELEKSVTMGDMLIKNEEPFVHFSVSLKKRDGTTLPVETRMQAVRDEHGQPLCITGTIIDISERVQMQQHALELMLKVRTVESLKGFLTSITHDLRTPLSTINTTVYLLRRRLENQPDENRYLDRLEEQVNYLIRAVEDILEMSHLEEEVVEFDFVRVNLHSLIRDVMFTLEPMSRAKQQRLTFDLHENVQFVVVDQMMLGKALRHLLKNAISYTPDNGAITIRVAQSAQWITVEIEDTGIGIEAEDLPLIFERFYKANKARTSGNAGTGLGLSIVKKIVDAHHGTIEVNSVLGQGSIFKLSLPLTPDQFPTPSPDATNRNRSAAPLYS